MAFAELPLARLRVSGWNGGVKGQTTAADVQGMADVTVTSSCREPTVFEVFSTIEEKLSADELSNAGTSSSSCGTFTTSLVTCYLHDHTPF